MGGITRFSHEASPEILGLAMRKIRAITIFWLCSICMLNPLQVVQKRYDYLAQHSDIAYVPWFTGSLLTPSPVNMYPNHPAIEPALIITDTYGKYDDNWKVKGSSNLVSVKRID